MNLTAFIRHSISIALLLIILCGCRAGVAPDAGFLHHTELLKKSDNIPFNAFWYKDSFYMKNYDTIVVAPIDLEHSLATNWWDRFTFASNSSESNPKKEAQKLATYLKEQIVSELKKNTKGPHFSEKPKGKTLKLEIAIVELIPTKVWLNSIAYGLAGPLDHGATAMEGRLRDLSTGEVVVRWKDQQYGQTAFVSVADIKWYAHSYHTADYWAQTIATFCRQGIRSKIDGRNTLTIKAW